MHSKIISWVKYGCCMKLGSVIEAGSMGSLPVLLSSNCKKGVMKSASTPSMSSPTLIEITI